VLDEDRSIVATTFAEDGEPLGQVAAREVARRRYRGALVRCVYPRYLPYRRLAAVRLPRFSPQGGGSWPTALRPYAPIPTAPLRAVRVRLESTSAGGENPCASARKAVGLGGREIDGFLFLRSFLPSRQSSASNSRLSSQLFCGRSTVSGAGTCDLY